MKLRHLLLTTLCLACILATAAQLSIPRISEKPVIDGQGEDAAWKNVPWHGDFTLLDRAPQKPAYATRFKVAHDNHHLYFLVECPNPPSGAIAPKATARDGAVWKDDCVEIFIDPNYDRDRFYQFAFNRANAVFDMEYTQGGIIAYLPWNAEKLVSATTENEKGWQLEMALPIVELSLEQDSGKMGINVARSVPKTTTETSSFAPINSSLRQPSKFAVAQLENASLKHFAWKLRSPYETQLIRRNGKLHYEGKLHLENATGKLQFASMEQRINQGGSATSNAIMDTGVGKEYQFSLPCDPDKATEFAVTIKDMRSGERLFARRFPLSVRYSPMSITLTNPPYRDNIYADMKVTALEGSVAVLDADCEGKPLSLQLNDQAGKVLAEKKFPAPGTFKLEIPELAVGAYTLTAQVGDCHCTKTVRRLAKHTGEVRFDAKNNMYVDGQRFYPYGWFSYTDLEAAQKAGYNMEIYYNGAYLHGENAQRHFDLYFKHGIRTIIYPYPVNKIYSKEKMRKPLNREEAEQIRARIRELKDHPGLLGWYIGDELESAPALHARVKEIYEICKEEDPYHPAVILNNSAGGYLKYSDCSDILLPDIYPNFLVGGDAGKPITSITRSLSIAKNAGNRVLWVTPQGFNYGDFGRTGQRGPNFVELRNMQYQSIVAGAKGFVWYVYCGSECYPDIIGGIAFLRKEAQMLSELYDAAGFFRKLPSASPDVILAEYATKNRHYVVAINGSTTPRDVVFPINGKSFFTAGEDDAFTVADGKLHDKLEKYQVKIYTTDTTLARSFRIADGNILIAETAKSLHKKGNIAYTPVSNAKVTLNFTPRGKGRPLWHLADGSTSRPMVPIEGKKVAMAVTMEFPKEQRASRARIYGSGIKSAVVEIEKDGQWVKLAKAEPITDSTSVNVLYSELSAVEATWPATTFTKIRFSELKTKAIGEIEIYE
ncbi:MAG: carbohydrate binding family 9 domain-containing protein, partial [Victivallales bacterium]|nr:carbohydrate binding family 9 domain-containing protein [Victivallales bacterium]